MVHDVGGERVAVMAHGAGSTGDFLRRAFGPALAAAGWSLIPIEDRSGSVTEVEDRLAETVLSTGAALVGGVSLGAHAAARWAARSPSADVTGLLLVLPAWTGRPSTVAAASAAAGAQVASLGVGGALQQLQDGSWVGTELARAWPQYGSGLAAALVATARSWGPERDELRRITLPTGVLGLRADPFHPIRVSRSWARLIPKAGLVELDASEAANGVEVLGAGALAALAAARVRRVLTPGPSNSDGAS